MEGGLTKEGGGGIGLFIDELDSIIVVKYPKSSLLSIICCSNSTECSLRLILNVFAVHNIKSNMFSNPPNSLILNAFSLF